MAWARSPCLPCRTPRSSAAEALAHGSECRVAASASGPGSPRQLARTAAGRRFAGQFGVVLFYRGAWCPYCNAQLRAFQRASPTLADAGVQVVALSVDDEVATAGLIAKTA